MRGLRAARRSTETAGNERRRHGRRIGVIAAALGVCAASLASGLALAATPEPIPNDPPDGPSRVPNFVGRVANVSPVNAPAVPRHPFMAANGVSNVHDDAYQTDTYTYRGPIGRNLGVSSQHFPDNGLCGITIAFDRFGRPLTNCISLPDRQELRLFDPRTLETLARYELPPRAIPPGANPFLSVGGAYFYLDNRDRVVLSIDRTVQVVALEGGRQNPHFEHKRTYGLSSAIPANEPLSSALPDWQGRIWFVSRDHGIVGVLDPKTGKILGKRRLNEAIGNSIAVGRHGVFVVTDKALYRFDADSRGRPHVSWRRQYRNTGEVKPGQFDAGSGTTPTLMGRKYVAITDNADPMHVVVYKRGRDVRGRRLVCAQAVFGKGASATENSLIGTGRSLIVENNYGYAPPVFATGGGNTTTPGLQRVDVNRAGTGCRTVWRSREIAPSVVPKLSLANGLVYTYTKPAGSPDAWYLTAINFHTGKTVWKRLTGTGPAYNNHYAGLAIAPNGVLYSGVLGGTVRVADRPRGG